MNINLSFDELDIIILRQHYSNNSYKTNWLNFKNNVLTYNKEKEILIKRDLPHLLIDFYSRKLQVVKNLKLTFNDFKVNIVENCLPAKYTNDNIHLYNSDKIVDIIKYNIYNLITKQLEIILHDVKNINI